MAKRSDVKATEIRVPHSQEEAEVLLGQIGSLQRKLTKEETAMNDQIAEIKTKYQKKAETITESILSAFKRLHAWAEVHKHELLKGKKKSAELSTGQVRWRKTPPKVNVKKTESAIQELKDAGLGRFIKTTEVIDKGAILKDQKAVEKLTQISVTQRNEFVAKPHDTNIEKVAKSKE